MEKRVKYGGILLLLFTIGLLLYGYFYRISEASTVEIAKASIPVNVNDLIWLSEKDEAQFNHQYLYKVLSVRGVIRKVKRSRSGINVLLGGHPALSQFISCNLDTLYNVRQPDIHTGDSCTIQGSCAGCLKDVVLLQCIIERN
jgi:hypothetical protein